MYLLVQNLLKSVLSMSSLAICVSILGNSIAIISRLYFLSCLMIYLS